MIDQKHCIFSFNGVLNVKGDQSNCMVDAFDVWGKNFGFGGFWVGMNSSDLRVRELFLTILSFAGIL